MHKMQRRAGDRARKTQSGAAKDTRRSSICHGAVKELDCSIALSGKTMLIERKRWPHEQREICLSIVKSSTASSYFLNSSLCFFSPQEHRGRASPALRSWTLGFASLCTRYSLVAALTVFPDCLSLVCLHSLPCSFYHSVSLHISLGSIFFVFFCPAQPRLLVDSMSLFVFGRRLIFSCRASTHSLYFFLII